MVLRGRRGGLNRPNIWRCFFKKIKLNRRISAGGVYVAGMVTEALCASQSPPTLPQGAGGGPAEPIGMAHGP